MKTIKLFAWFAYRSWFYMRGNRREYVTGFWRAWRRFYELDKNRYHAPTDGGHPMTDPTPRQSPLDLDAIEEHRRTNGALTSDQARVLIAEVARLRAALDAARKTVLAEVDAALRNGPAFMAGYRASRGVPQGQRMSDLTYAQVAAEYLRDSGCDEFIPRHAEEATDDAA